MPRKKMNATPLQPSTTYWEEFLTSQGLPLGEEEPIVTSPSTPEFTGPVPKDPEFVEFLKIASRYGAPKNMTEFRKLDIEKKKYYLRAYTYYLKEEAKRKQREAKPQTA